MRWFCGGGALSAGGLLAAIMIAALGAGSWAAQLGGIADMGTFAIALTLLLAVVLKAVTGLRVDGDTEREDLDLAVHDKRTCDAIF